MAEKLLRYFRFVDERAGLIGITKLAMETKLPVPKAALAPDSPEHIQRFREAVKKVTGEEPPHY